MRTFLASVSLATFALLAPFSANAAFTIKVFAAPVDTGTGVDFGNQIGQFTNDVIAFTSADLQTSDPGWPLATETFGTEVTGYLNTDTDGADAVYLGSARRRLPLREWKLGHRPSGRPELRRNPGGRQPDGGVDAIPHRVYNGPCRGTGLALSADDRVTITAARVPEPGTYALMAGGLVAVAAGARSRRRKQIA